MLCSMLRLSISVMRVNEKILEMFGFTEEFYKSLELQMKLLKCSIEPIKKSFIALEPASCAGNVNIILSKNINFV